MSEGSERPVNTLCPICRGLGVRRVPRAAMINGQFGTMLVEEICQLCDGDGWRSGLEPPV
ncbi:MAG: hypothetical protein GEV03_07380 [Streptosporangiales bacterium]|nr:hypothetical protein [Streptosporangiales bacterium]